MSRQPKGLTVFETIDARAWRAPEPLVRTLEALERLPRGHELVLLAPCQPRPLFRVLKLNGFDYRCRFDPAGHFEVRIWHGADTPAASASFE